MPVYKDNKTNTWRAVFRYTDWTGEKNKRKNEALLLKERQRLGKKKKC